jgi:hypothetical protein
MKNIISSLLFVLLSNLCLAQFEGILHYECISKNQVLMSVYLTPGKARIEAKIVPFNNGIANVSAAKDQHIIIFDLVNKKEIKLIPDMKLATVSGFTEILMDSVANLTEKDISVQNLGSEKVGNFLCDHYMIMIKASRKDLWVTKDLGISGLYVGSEFLYYANGGLVYQKLTAAGAAGLVVKSLNGKLTTELKSYEKKVIPAAMFQIPSNYQIIDRNTMMQGRN